MKSSYLAWLILAMLPVDSDQHPPGTGLQREKILLQVSETELAFSLFDNEKGFDDEKADGFDDEKVDNFDDEKADGFDDEKSDVFDDEGEDEMVSPTHSQEVMCFIVARAPTSFCTMMWSHRVILPFFLPSSLTFYLCLPGYL